MARVFSKTGLVGLASAAWLTLGWSTLAGADWDAVADERGVVVEEQRVPGRSLPIFRGTAEIDASPELIVDVIQDVGTHTRWMPNCAESRVLTELDGQTLLYRRTEAPWPVADRDVVISSRIEVVEPGREIRVLFDSVEAPVAPPRPGIVRMPRVSGFYAIRALDDGRSRVEYHVDADPGGRLPAWLASATAKDNPVLTLSGLREQVALKRRNAVGSAR